MPLQFEIIEPALPQPQAGALQIQGLNLELGGTAVLEGVELALPATGVTTLIGPSGAGKSSLLRCINGLHQGWQGQIELAGRDIHHWPGGWDQLRRHVGLIAQKPCVFPQSIRANVVFGIQGWRQRRRADALVEAVLRQAALWDEVSGRLTAPAETLSLGQQQRLCIARALAIKPGLLLLDEPTASLDPRSKQLIEQSIKSLAESMPLVCVTHDLEQARRLGGQVVFMCEGKVIERADCESFFQRPQRLESREFLSWNVCQC
ncbi:MAG TPA: ATP-binding cassette domain-containing protein [Candidatus Tenderia electrophaga]|uniref:ATP-binding cassette domain-containing protein n=1 Tax=Candidatus Tenderia electrophaga TaxID=1748243 RepID=A0A832N5P8_9GAMM|nr:ATP-binding cassette domain-containing protein [Candidatus Tenderia electrophaga]